MIKYVKVGDKPGCENVFMRVLSFAAILILMLAGTVAMPSPSHANHITSFDCEVNDEQRGPYGNVSVGIRWSNSDTLQKMTQFSMHNWDVYPHTITMRYQRFTDGHVYHQQGFTVASQSIRTVVGLWTEAHNQSYHAGVKVYRDSTYVFSINLWYDSFRGTVTWRADLTNCTPS